MTRRAGASVVASPVLVGAVTVLVTIVAVFLAYNANQGLPFVPTYDVGVVVPDAAGLVRGNEVRVGGFRVGIVKSIAPVARRSGHPIARLHLQLDRTEEPIRSDTTIIVRPRSPLGLKYLEMTVKETMRISVVSKRRTTLSSAPTRFSKNTLNWRTLGQSRPRAVS